MLIRKSGCLILTLTMLSLFGATFASGVDVSKRLNLDDHGVALHGFDPVSYFAMGGPVAGKPGISAQKGPAKYLFANEVDRRAFLGLPDKYRPLYGGWCAYSMAEGQFVDSDPTTFKINKDGRLLLFQSGVWGNNLTKWNKNEQELTLRANAQWGRLFSDTKAK